MLCTNAKELEECLRRGHSVGCRYPKDTNARLTRHRAVLNPRPLGKPSKRGTKCVILWLFMRYMLLGSSGILTRWASHSFSSSFWGEALEGTCDVRCEAYMLFSAWLGDSREFGRYNPQCESFPMMGRNYIIFGTASLSSSFLAYNKLYNGENDQKGVKCGTEGVFATLGDSTLIFCGLWDYAHPFCSIGKARTKLLCWYTHMMISGVPVNHSLPYFFYWGGCSNRCLSSQYP